MSETVAYITAIAGLIAVFVSLFTATNAAKKDAFNQLQAVVTTLQTENHKLTIRVSSLEKELIRKDAEIDKRDDMIGDLQDWAENLVNQVKAAGLVPVPFKKRRAK